MRVLNSMRKKISYPIARIILKGSELPVRTGWDETINSIHELARDENLQDKMNACLNAYSEALLCINKSVQIYDVNQDSSDLIRRTLPRLSPEDGLFSDNYPHCLTKEELDAIDNEEIKLVCINELDHGVACVFCSKAFSELRNIYNSNDFDDNVAQVFGNADEIIAITREALQLFHVVWVPNDTNYIEVRIDASEKISIEKAATVRRRLTEKFNQLMGRIVLNPAVNFFSAIKNIYEAEDEGIVVNMSFTTQTGSTKNEKMRKQGLDLRKEEFHCGGCEAVDNEIDPFRVSVRWDSDREGYVIRPEITLNSSWRNSASNHPSLYEFTASNAMCIEDYDFLVNKVLQYK